MTDSTRVMSRPWHPLCRRGLPVAAFVAAAVLALAACSSGGSPSATGSSSAGGSTSSRSAVAYSACMRSHGVPNYPDPGNNGQLPKNSPQQLGVSSSLYQAAQRACQSLLPTTGSMSFEQQFRQCLASGDCPQALVQQAMTLHAEFRSVHALARGAELARSHDRPRGALLQRQWSRPEPPVHAFCGGQVQGKRVLKPGRRLDGRTRADGVRWFG
jgi:hypothetical protein